MTYDPLVRGYVATLARPTGRVTGLFFQQIELTVKRVQLLEECIPGRQQEAAQRLGLSLLALRLEGALQEAGIDVFFEVMGGYGTVLRSLRTPFVDQWRSKREEIPHIREHLYGDSQLEVPSSSASA